MWQVAGLLFILELSLPAFAAVKINDDLGLLQRINQIYRGSYSFEQAFSCGDEQKFRADTTSCSYRCGFGCASRCNDAVSLVQKRFVLGVEECSSERVMIYGDNGFFMEVLRSDYEAGGNSLIIPLLKSHGFFITPESDVDLDFASIVGITVIENGAEVKKMAVRLAANVGLSSQGHGFDLEIVWIPEEKGLHSLVFFRHGLTSYFLRRNDVRETLPGFEM